MGCVIFLLHCVLIYETIMSDLTNIQLIYLDFVYINLCFFLNSSTKYKDLNENKRKIISYIIDYSFLFGAVIIAYLIAFPLTFYSGIIFICISVPFCIFVNMLKKVKE